MVVVTGTLIFAVSFVFAMLGLGGGMLYVPIFHWLGFGLKNVVIPLALLLNGLNTLVALVPYGRKRLVDWKGGLPMAVGALVGAPVGALIAPHVPSRILLILFSILVLAAGARTLAVVNQPDPPAEVGSGRRIAWGTVVATLAGVLGGMLGIGGGFLISPLLLWIGYRTKTAAATTAYIVTFSSFSGFLGHVGHMAIRWPLLAITLAAVLAASLAGSSFMANRAKPSWVRLLYGVLLVGVAAKLLWPLIAA